MEGTIANFDINIFIIARENWFHPYKIGRAPYGVRLISYNAGRAPYGSQSGIGRCYHLQTPAGARTTCDHTRENSLKSPGALVIIKFAGDVQIKWLKSYDVCFICDHSINY